MAQHINAHVETAPVGWGTMCARVFGFALVLSPLGGAITGAVVGTVVAAVHGIDGATGTLGGIGIGLQTGLLNGIAAAWLVRRKRLPRLLPVLAGAVLTFSLPFAMVPSDAVILICLLAGMAGFWIALIAEDFGYVHRLLDRVCALADKARETNEAHT